MHVDAGKVRAAGDVGELRPIQLADGGNHCIEPAADLLPVDDHLHGPESGGLIVGSGRDLGPELDILFDTAAACHFTGIGVDFGPLGELLWPVVPLREREAVGVVGRIQTHPGIGVLPPGPAYGIALLEDGVGNIGLPKPVGGSHPGHARTDDGYAELPACGNVLIVPAGLSALALRQCHVVHQERVVLGGGRVGDPLQDGGRLILVKCLDACELLIAYAPQCLEGQLPRLHLCFLGHPPVRLPNGVGRRLGRTKIGAKE